MIAAFIQALPDSALVIDERDNVVAANAAAVDLFRMPLERLPITSILRQSIFVTALSSVRRDGEPTAFEFDLHGKLQRLLGAHVAPLGKDGMILITLRDLTREQAVEKMRSDFVAHASHELRTPLTAIIGGIETLQGPSKNDPKGQTLFLASMSEQARRMKRLIDDLLTLSRIELNEHVRPNAQVKLRGIAEQARSNLSETAKQAQVSVEISGEVGAVVGDADELLQVVQNLIENAIKYGAAGKRVEVTCESNQDYGILRVRDFGPGIEEIHLPRLTERFYRVNTRQSRQTGGTGLGLAIVKHIVTRHHGRLEIASEVGKGSTFTVSIPLFIS